MYSMFRGTIGCVNRGVATAQTIRCHPQPPAWVGCSHWTTPFRSPQPFSTSTRQEDGGLFDPPTLSEEHGSLQNSASHHGEVANLHKEDPVNVATSHEGIIMDQINPHSLSPDNTSSLSQRPGSSTRPSLPTSIKKLNRLLSHSRDTTIPESDLIEKFVKGRGPGGQAINKTNSSVSLIHIPTGIRIQSQPTRSREENRKIARKILGERLDLIRARAGGGSQLQPGSVGGSSGSEVVNEIATGSPIGQSRKEKEKVLAKQFSRDEIRWEKERRRKSNKAKKAKKKHGPGAVKSDASSVEGEE